MIRVPLSIALDDDYQMEPGVEDLMRAAYCEQVSTALATSQVDSQHVAGGQVTAEPVPINSPQEDDAHPVWGWLRRAIATFPSSSSEQPWDWESCALQLIALGAVSSGDFHGLTPEELLQVWPPFQSSPAGFARHALACLSSGAARLREAQPATISHSHLERADRERTPRDNSQVQTFVACMTVLRLSRQSGSPPAPRVLAASLRQLARAPRDWMELRWRHQLVSVPPTLPRARAAWAQELDPVARGESQILLEEDAIWKLLASWLTSASQYASAVQLWGEAASCASAGSPPLHSWSYLNDVACLC